MKIVKVAVIGVNDANIQEIKNIVLATIGDNAEIVTAIINNYEDIRDADLYVCLINRKQEVENIFGNEKVVALTFVPPTEYFLEISKIPADRTVVIFNNSIGGTKVLMGLLASYNLMHVRYEVVPYDEWDEQQIAAKLAVANYIIGGIASVAEGRTLHSRFEKYIPQDAVILVSPPRIATGESVSHLSRVFGFLYHQEVIKTLEKLASLDYLTQMPNRRTFDERITVDCKCGRRKGYPLILAMIDIDFFKRFNDHYGHLAGDECLKKVAQKMRTIVRRPADFCARYGGEEFVVVLPDTDIAGGRHILEKIRSGIEELAIEHQDSSVAAVVTVSIGAATSIPTTERSTETAVAGVIERADKALYQAKRQGRNRVVIYERAT